MGSLPRVKMSSSRRIERICAHLAPQPASDAAISADELKKHKSKTDCWIAVQGKVIDVTSFLPDHPGGLKTLLKNGGKESTEVFEAFHRDGLLDKFIKNGTVKVVGKFA